MMVRRRVTHGAEVHECSLLCAVAESWRNGAATMKQFACGDVVPGCDARWVCDTDDEILAQVAVHGRDVHGLDDIPPELVDEVRSRISSA
jgi:predicted small metal-binding protein